MTKTVDVGFPAACLALLLTVVGASPTLMTKWTVPIPSNAQVALVSHNMVLLSSQTQTPGGFRNTIRAATAKQSSLWTQSSLGQTTTYNTAFAFPVIPKLIFLLVNNIQPPNVSAVIPSTGTVVWSTPAAFDAVLDGTLVASVDGSTLYLFTSSPAGNTQMTAIDSSSGEVLFAEGYLWAWFSYLPVRCGASNIGCIANSNGTTDFTFLDGRTGAILGNVSFAPQSSPKPFVSVAPNALVLVDSLNIYMISTTNYTVMWTRPLLRMYSSVVQLMPTVLTPGSVLVVADPFGVYAVNPLDGELMWNSTVSVICPEPLQATGLGGYPMVAQRPSVGPLFALSFTCLYNTGKAGTILGWMNVTSGAIGLYRYLSHLPTGLPIPLGSYFMVPSPGGASQDFYDSRLFYVGSYPPWGCGINPSTPVVQQADAVFTLSCWNASEVSAVTVAG